MSTIIKGLEHPKNERYLFKDFFCFIDSDKNVFIIGDEHTVINISSPLFTQYPSECYLNIEDFLQAEFGTTLLKAFDSQNEFDIEIIVK